MLHSTKQKVKELMTKCHDFLKIITLQPFEYQLFPYVCTRIIDLLWNYLHKLIGNFT
jgi:hypothetical protein